MIVEFAKRTHDASARQLPQRLISLLKDDGTAIGPRLVQLAVAPACECSRSLRGKAAILLALAAAPPAARTKVGRNDPCPCGSGKKYKKCCLGRD